MTAFTWRKSSRSGTTQDAFCVQVAAVKVETLASVVSDESAIVVGGGSVARPAGSSILSAGEIRSALAGDDRGDRRMSVPREVFGPSEVPDALLLGQARLYTDADGSPGVGYRGLSDGNWREIGALADYSPIFWLTGLPHDYSSEPVVTVAEMVNVGLSDAVDYLTAYPESTEADRVERYLGEHTRRVVRQTRELPEGLPAGTWIWFSGAQRTGAMIVLAGGQYGVHVPGTHVGVAGARRVRSVIGEGPHTFVIADPVRIAIAPAEMSQVSEVRPGHVPELSAHHVERGPAIDPVVDVARRLNERLASVLPRYDGEAADCLIRMGVVRSHFYPGPRVARDDFALNTGRYQDELAAAVGGDWRPVSHSLDLVVDRLEELGHGAMAFVLTSPPGGRRRHGFVLRNEGGTVFRIETQASEGERVSPAREGSSINPGAGWLRQPSTGARAIVVDPSGRAVPLTEDMVTAASTAGALVDPSPDLAYGAMGVELELPFIVHRHDGEDFSYEQDVDLFKDEAMGISLTTEDVPIWVAGGKYFHSEQRALDARLGPVTEKNISTVELVNNPPQGVILSDEDNLKSHEENFRNIRDALRILGTSRPLSGVTGPGQRGTPLKDLFPPDGQRLYSEEGEDSSIMPGPWRTNAIYAQLSVGLPLESIPDFHVFFSGVYEESPAIIHNLARSLGFGRQMARKFIESRVGNRVDKHAVSAMRFAPMVGAVRAAMEILATHSLAVVQTYFMEVNDGVYQRIKNEAIAPSRLSFAGIHDSLDREVQEFIVDNADYIKKHLKYAIKDRYGSSIRQNEKSAQGGNGDAPLDIFDYPLSGEDVTLGDYVDNMVLPRSQRRVHIDQNQAMNIRTNFEHADTNFGRLTHELIVVEFRYLGKVHQTIDEIEAKFKAVADYARQAYDNRTKLRANEQTAEGRSYSHRLTEAVKSLGGRPRGADLISRVRDLLDDAVTGAFESLRDPITRGDVTTNLLADTVLSLHAFDKIGDLKAGSLRKVIEALKPQVTATAPPESPAYAAAVSFINKADGLIGELQRREMNHLSLGFPTGQSMLQPDQRSALAVFAQHVAREAGAYAERRPGLVVRVYGPGVGVKGPLGSQTENDPGTNVASLLRQLVYEELGKVGVGREVVVFEIQERSIDPSGPQPKEWRPVWVSLEPAPMIDSGRGRDDHSSSSDRGHRHKHS
jgi:hypothetical protein